MRTTETRIWAPLSNVTLRDSGAADAAYTIHGHAAVFNLLSLDLGGFQEKIDPGAFGPALSRDPDVHAVWDHDTRWPLGRTRNKTLNLAESEIGLEIWSRPAATSWASDLRILMERGDIDQASFMFTIARERWEWAGGDDDPIIATIEEVGELYDVTVTARGAYPQTDMTVQNTRMARLATALHEGRVPGLTLDGATERGLVTKEPEHGREASPEGVTETGADEVAAREQTHRVAVEQAKRRRAGVNSPA